MKRRGVKWSGVEWSEWSGVKWSRVGWENEEQNRVRGNQPHPQVCPSCHTLVGTSRVASLGAPSKGTAGGASRSGHLHVGTRQGAERGDRPHGNLTQDLERVQRCGVEEAQRPAEQAGEVHPWDQAGGVVPPGPLQEPH